MLERLRDEGGYTLFELVVVCALLSVVLGAVTTVLVNGSHAELQLNNRFKAQEAARLGLAAIRTDAHAACAATVNAGKTQVTFSVPKNDSAGVAPTPTQQCGTVSNNIAKIIWCVLTSPTNGTKYALYRSTTGTCTTSSKLVADSLVNTLTGFNGFFVTGATVNYGEMQSVDVDIPVSTKQGTFGAPYELKQKLALRNTVWSTSAGQSCSVSVPCSAGPCDLVGGCYPPTIT